MRSHTPGPWKIEHETNVMSSDGRRSVASCGNYQSNVNTENVRSENQANALLIAAAPELLEVARAIMAFVEANDLRRIRDAARAAVARATGEKIEVAP